MDAKAADFLKLHRRGAPFVIPNPWDVGSARLLYSKGFKALATTSAGHAFALGRTDGAVSWDEKLEHCRQIVEATPLPVSADLEYGKGASAESVFEAVTEAMATGLAGGSIEDYSGDPAQPIFDEALALERIEAAIEAKRGGDFVLTARCENFLWSRPDLDATIRRLAAFEAAGADVLYAPGLRTLEEIRAVCSALAAPVNVVVGIGRAVYTLAELADAGVARISTGSSLAKLAYRALLEASDEMLAGSFEFASRAAAAGESPNGCDDKSRGGRFQPG